MRLRELRISYAALDGAPRGPRPRLNTPRIAASIIRPLIEHETVEVFGMLLLNVAKEPLAWHVLSRGCLDATLVHPREVIKAACLANAAAVIVAHNHPSGDPSPSREDLALTCRLQGALALVGIGLLDSVVIGDEGRYWSANESGVL
jgi:DNA repair protein RadC